MFQIHTIKNLGRAGYKIRGIVSKNSNPISDGSECKSAPISNIIGITQLTRPKNHKTGGKFYGNNTKKVR